MNCYNFELNISAYIEGNIQQSLLKIFVEHKDSCTHCREKLKDISSILDNLSQLSKINTSSQFSKRLKERIYELDNKEPTFWQTIIGKRPFGFDPLPAFGLALSAIMIIGSSYFLLNQDNIPNIDINKLSEQSAKINPDSDKYKPLIISPLKDTPSMADSDTSIRKQPVQNKSIKLVGGAKGR